MSRELAILDGRPAFTEPLHVGRPSVGNVDTFLARAREMLERRWFTNDGPFVREFEQRVAELVGVKHCVAMCNATIALEIAIRALDLRGEVIVPSYTFIASAHSLQWQEITPVFADIDPNTHNIDPDAVKRLVTPRTSGIIGVHIWGRACDTDALEFIARGRGIKVMYDAAHAFGCSHKGRMIGSFGHCEVFSFHATKFFNTFEGGAVVTNDDTLAQKMRLMRNFGFSGYDNVIYLGTNGKMTEICAAMGLTSLEAMDDLIALNRRNYNLYREQLDSIRGLSLIDYGAQEKRNFQYIVVKVDPSVSGLSRDEVVAVLHAENVLARKYFWPGCHRMEPYRSYFPNAGLLLHNTERIASEVLLLPTGQAVASDSINTICRIIRTAIEQRELVHSKLRSAPSGV